MPSNTLGGALCLQFSVELEINFSLFFTTVFSWFSPKAYVLCTTGLKEINTLKTNYEKFKFKNIQKQENCKISIYFWKYVLNVQTYCHPWLWIACIWNYILLYLNFFKSMHKHKRSYIGKQPFQWCPYITFQTCTTEVARIKLNKIGCWAVILDNFPVSGNKTALVNVVSATASCSSHLSFPLCWKHWRQFYIYIYTLSHGQSIIIY